MLKDKTKVSAWLEKSREIVFQKYSRKIEKVIFELPNGEESDFYIKKEGPTVCLLALTKNNEVILAKQFRPGPKEILLELPGGGIEPGESPEVAGARELLEETGYSGQVQLVVKANDCGYSTMQRYCLVATNCELIAPQKLDPTEFIEVVLLNLADFRALIRQGRLTDIEVAYLGLDFLKLL